MSRCRITGYLWSPTGAVIATGRLLIQLRSDIVTSDLRKISPVPVSVDLVATSGYIDVSLEPTSNASPANVGYRVEYHPDPSNLTQPQSSLPGFFVNTWNVPPVASLSVGYFVSAERGEPLTNYVPLGAPPMSWDGVPISIVSTALGGTGSDLSGASPGVVVKDAIDGSLMVRVLAGEDIASGIVASARLPAATLLSLGAVRPDGVTITISEDGVLSLMAIERVAQNYQMSASGVVANTTETLVSEEVVDYRLRGFIANSTSSGLVMVYVDGFEILSGYLSVTSPNTTVVLPNPVIVTGLLTLKITNTGEGTATYHSVVLGEA